MKTLSYLSYFRTLCKLFCTGLSLAHIHAKPLKVFILAGQSNMQGHAKIHTLEHLGMSPSTASLPEMVLDSKGKPLIHDQIKISSLSTNGIKQGNLTTGFGANDEKIGPELFFGISAHQILDEPILIIKTAWGGKSLHTDFRPPSAGAISYNQARLDHFKAQGKDIEELKAQKKADTSKYYRLMIDHIKKVLNDIESIVPEYDVKDGYDLAGFVWFQGWNDVIDRWVYPDIQSPYQYKEYSKVLAHLIRGVRKDLSAPEMPFIIGVIGVGGPKHSPSHDSFRKAMANPTKLPEFKGNVRAVYTENFWDQELHDLVNRDAKLKHKTHQLGLKNAQAQAHLEKLRAVEFTPEERQLKSIAISNQPYHYLGSAKIMAQVGQAFAKSVLNIPLIDRSLEQKKSRTWTQVSTGKTLQGDLVAVDGNQNTISIRSAGKSISIPISMLSDADRAYIKNWQIKQGKITPSSNQKQDTQSPNSEDRILDVKKLKRPKAKDDIPDLLKDSIELNNRSKQWTLGPTGLRGWMYADSYETSEARQILITEVEERSPAHGILEKNDVILGVQAQPFSDDPRVELGKAISQAEASDGKLALTCWRSGKLQNFTIHLPILGAYSDTAPFDCPKSKKILTDGYEALAEELKKSLSPHAVTSHSKSKITRSLNALALLASGESKYHALVKQEVKKLATYSDPEHNDLHSWKYGPITILVAEYTMATGDQEFLPELERLTHEIIEGQSRLGSWGHKFRSKELDSLQGYGMINLPGLSLSIALALAREAGIENPRLDRAINKSADFFRFYVGKGSIPYGDHRPWIQTHDDNGKNGAAAIFFNILGEQKAAEYFSRMSTACHSAEREFGHTGNFFNLLWALPSVCLSGENASGAWMKEYGWYFDSVRRWDSRFTHQGPAKEKRDSYEGWDSTGAYLLAYAQPLRQLYLTGKKQSLVTQVDQAEGISLVEDGKGWSPRLKKTPFAHLDQDELLKKLSSWSPVVRERAAMALANLGDDHFVSDLIRMLNPTNPLHTRLGACQALAALKERGERAVRELRRTLDADDLWLRIKAAEALSAIGEAAMPAAPRLLEMLSSPDPERDPRGMLQRYLSFALFGRGGFLENSLEEVDREALFRAVREGLKNENGRPRGAYASIYLKLPYSKIRPLLPSIIQAVAEPAPSGLMFNDEIRMAGLELLANNNHQEGLDYIVDVIGIERWGLKKRFSRCMDVLKTYRGAAKHLIPELKKLEEILIKTRPKDKAKITALKEVIEIIKNDNSPPKLKFL